MAERVHVRATEGRTVGLEGPPIRFLKPGEEAEVELTTHVRRRLRAGDLELVPAAGEPAPAKGSRR